MLRFEFKLRHDAESSISNMIFVKFGPKFVPNSASRLCVVYVCVNSGTVSSSGTSRRAKPRRCAGKSCHRWSSNLPIMFSIGRHLCGEILSVWLHVDFDVSWDSIRSGPIHFELASLFLARIVRHVSTQGLFSSITLFMASAGRQRSQLNTHAVILYKLWSCCQV